MTGISVERAHRILLQGAELVGSVVDELPDDSAVLERAQNVRDLLTDLTWCQSSRGSAQVLHDQRLTDVLLVLFPNRELGHLGHSAAFQAAPNEDGTLRLNVRAVSFTPLWAGLGLFHELSHIHDFRSDVEPREPSTEQYLEGEARAYHLEAVLLDTLAAGRLSAALALKLHTPLTPEELATERGASLSSELERATAKPGQPPPGSNCEAGVRDVAHRIAALLAFHFEEAQLLGMQHPEAAGSGLGRFFAAAPPMEQS